MVVLYFLPSMKHQFIRFFNMNCRIFKSSKIGITYIYHGYFRLNFLTRNCLFLLFIIFWHTKIRFIFSNPIKMSEITAIVSLEDSDIYQGERCILSDVNFSVFPGEFVYLLGRVGTGKTSLIKTIHGELPLRKGTGNVAGFSLNPLKKSDVYLLRRKVGVVFQDFRLLMEMDVYANLAFVLKATGWTNKTAIDTRITEVLLRVGMEDSVTRMPHQLSGGEQQRIVIARAILNDPDVLLADEPTGNLDPDTSGEILELFTMLNKSGKTILMATHDYASIAGKPARTLVFDGGKVYDSKANDTLIDFTKLI